MSGPDEQPGLAELRDHWRAFARSAPLDYVRIGSREDDRAGFYASGSASVARILDFVGRDVERGRVLEVGCGPGRLLAALAAEFESVDGVDIAPEMIEAARAAELPSNVRVRATSGADLAPFADGSFDLVISLLVIQHIPHQPLIAANLREMRRVLKSSGRAFIQFDSRPADFRVRLLQVLPDPLLPRIRRRYIRRYRRSPAAIATMLAEAGLHVLQESGTGSANHRTVVSHTP